MRIGLIDLGSNTIKLAIYEVLEDSFHQIYYDAEYAYIVGWIENHCLRPEGIEKIIEVISHYQRIAEEFEIGSMFPETMLDCFSTASLRYIENQQEVIHKVAQKTGVLIHPISGQQEALYNFLGMKRVAFADRFLGGDLGGGSLQLFVCKDRTLAAERSFPLGSLKLYHEFVEDLFPTRKEAAAICQYVQNTICHQMDTERFSSIFLMGGTTRFIVKLLGETEQFSVRQLEQRIEEFLQDPQAAKQQIEAVIPERLKTILPGMLILHTVAGLFSVETIHYTENSVREGYLTELLQSRQSEGLN